MSDEESSIGNSREIYARRQLDAIAARWDARAATWDMALEDPACHLNEDDAYRRFIRVIRRLVAGRRKFCAAHGVIDVGCGTGLVLGAIGSAFGWAIGIDISPRMIEAARAKGLAKTQFLLGDCFNLASLCPKAGVVASRGVLLSHYGREQGQSLLEAGRAALLPGGFLIFDFLNEDARRNHRSLPENKTAFRGEEIQSMALRCGFSKATTLGKPSDRALLVLAETDRSSGD